MLTTVDAVIDGLGGDAVTCALATVGPSALSNWRKRGKLPPEYFMLFSEALEALGKQADPAIFRFKEAVTDEARA